VWYPYIVVRWLEY